jgi:hypothetical protein
VQHLIEKCICYSMNREECMETLEKHAHRYSAYLCLNLTASIDLHCSRFPRDQPTS